MPSNSILRVKLPKTFLAVNLSDAFSFEENDKLASDSEVLEMKATPPKDLLSTPAPQAKPAEGEAGDAKDAEPAGGKVVNP